MLNTMMYDACHIGIFIFVSFHWPRLLKLKPLCPLRLYRCDVMENNTTMTVASTLFSHFLLTSHFIVIYTQTSWIHIYRWNVLPKSEFCACHTSCITGKEYMLNTNTMCVLVYEVNPHCLQVSYETTNIPHSHTFDRKHVNFKFLSFFVLYQTDMCSLIVVFVFSLSVNKNRIHETMPFLPVDAFVFHRMLDLRKWSPLWSELFQQWYALDRLPHWNSLLFQITVSFLYCSFKLNEVCLSYFITNIYYTNSK